MSVSAVMVMLVLGFLYFFPAYVAWRRGHPNVAAIAALNLLLGWTGLGWIGALVWGLTKVRA